MSRAAHFAALETPGADPAQAPQAPQAPAEPAPAAARSPRQALADRNAELQGEIDQHFKNAGAEPGSEPYNDYWKRGGADAGRVALERLEARRLDASTDAMATLAGSGAPAAPETSEPAPDGS
jgi:hypothetical protein